MGNKNEDSRDDDIQCIEGDNSVDHEEIKPSVGQYVVAMYEGAKYIGLIIEVDEGEGDAKINFNDRKHETEECIRLAVIKGRDLGQMSRHNFHHQ
jgi:hypothetical protein